jgi:DNA gyrase subunit B
MSIGEAVTEVVTLHGTGTFEEKVPVEGRMTLVERTCTVDVALRWVKGFDASVTSFVNTIPTPEGGTHVAGFERAMTKVTNDVLLAGTKKLAKLAKSGKDRAEKGDVQEGLVAAVKVTLPEPQFKGQTKQELGTPPVQSIVYEVVRDGFTNWIEGGGRKTHVAAVREKVAQAVLTRVSTKASLDLRRKAATLPGRHARQARRLPHPRPDAELLIVEATPPQGRRRPGATPSTWRCCRCGKVVNAGKSTLKQVIENAEAQALFSAIAGSGRTSTSTPPATDA